jgi:hypothetical protein
MEQKDAFFMETLSFICKKINFYVILFWVIPKYMYFCIVNYLKNEKRLSETIQTNRPVWEESY